MTRGQHSGWLWVATVAALGLACVVWFSFGQGTILTREACGSVSRERALLLSALNPTVRLTTAEWKSFGLSCLAGYAYETTSPDGRATQAFMVIDMQTGYPVFLHHARLTLRVRPEPKRQENTPRVGRVEI